MIQEIFNPSEGPAASKWRWLSPHSTQKWAAFKFTSRAGEESWLLLGKGDTSLNFSSIRLGGRELLCLGGFLYYVSAEEILAGFVGTGKYRQMMKGIWRTALCSQNELLILDRRHTRYSASIALGELEIIGLGVTTVRLRGLRPGAGKAVQEWTVRIRDIPDVYGHEF